MHTYIQYILKVDTQVCWGSPLSFTWFLSPENPSCIVLSAICQKHFIHWETETCLSCKYKKQSPLNVFLFGVKEPGYWRWDQVKISITGCDRCLVKPLRQKKVEEERGQAARRNESVGSKQTCDWNLINLKESVRCWWRRLWDEC